MKMKALENKAEKSGISKLLLMENAGAKLAVEIIKKFKDIKNISIHHHSQNPVTNVPTGIIDPAPLHIIVYCLLTMLRYIILSN